MGRIQKIKSCIIFLFLILLASSCVEQEIQEIEPRPSEKVEWLDNCQVRKVGDKYNTIIGRTFWVNDSDGKCKPIEKAKSLKNSPIKCIVKKDKPTDPDVECLDYNLTWVKLDVKDKVKKHKIKIYEEGNKSKIKLETDKVKLDVVELNINFTDEIHIGETSTTIKLQDPDTENIDDASILEEFPDTNYGDATTLRLENNTDERKFFYIKFNISFADKWTVIKDATLHIYPFSGYANSPESLYAFHVFNQTWSEETITWNTRVCQGANQCNSSIADTIYKVTLPKWYFWNLTDEVQKDVIDLNDYFSIFAKTNSPNYITMYSKEEEAQTAHIPFLNITYTVTQHVPSTPTSLQCDDGNCNATFTSNIDVNCSGSTDTDGDVITYTVEKGNYTHDECSGTPTICNVWTNETACVDAGCSWSAGGSFISKTVFYDDFEHNTEWTNWTEAGGVNWLITNEGSCAIESVDCYGTYCACVERDTDGSLSMTNSVDLSGYDDCVLYWEQWLDNGMDYLIDTFSVLVKNGSDTYTEVYKCISNGCDNDAWTSKSYNFTSGIGLGNSVRVKLLADTGGEEEIMVDNINITCSGTTSDVCSGTPDPCGTYNNSETNCTKFGCDFENIYSYSDVGNHTEGNTYTWDISSEPDETYERMRCRAIDLNGTNTYSDYYTISTNLTINYQAGGVVGKASIAPSYLQLKKRWWY